MWEIFLVLFGGVYWASKIGSEKVALRQADAVMERYRANKDRWYQQVCDDQLETRLRHTPGTPEFSRQCAEAIAVIRTLPGLENANFAFYGRRDSKFYVSQMVLYIQMVKRGKLSYLCRNELGNFLELSLDTRPTKKARIAFGQWVENSLKSAGVEGANLYYTKKNYASFEWEPFVTNFSQAIRVTDTRLESQMLGMD